MGKTTSDEINLDLNGTIDAAIKKLTKLKRDYPKGRIQLTSDYEYGESYPRLKLHFERPKETIEIELERWQEKQRRYNEMLVAANAYEANGDDYPRSAELRALKEELGCFAGRMVWLQIWDKDTIVSRDMIGFRKRNGEYVAKFLGAESLEKMMAELDNEK